MMPLYDYECPECGLKEDIWAKISENFIECPSCGKGMKRLISAPGVICDIEPYIDWNMAQEGVQINSRQHHKQEMKERGLIEYEPFGPKKKFYPKQRWI
jgi:putative FmdB family regulatory protein